MDTNSSNELGYTYETHHYPYLDGDFGSYNRSKLAGLLSSVPVSLPVSSEVRSPAANLEVMSKDFGKFAKSLIVMGIVCFLLLRAFK